MRRSITYPDHPGSGIETEAVVKAGVGNVWDTHITVSGTYTGPTDIVAVRDYKLTWNREGLNIIESGSATLVLQSGGTVRQRWTSTITPVRALKELPPAGESISITVSPFRITGNSMSYDWEGTVRVRPR